jgi:hypothetical protein
VTIFFLIAAASVPAQEAVQNMLLDDAAAAARARQMAPAGAQDYSFKQGDFRLLVVPSLGLEYCDNVNLADTGALDDFILMPSVAMTASYPFTAKNLLYLDFTVGYDQYLKHSRISSIQLNSSSGTGISLDVALKKIALNFHDAATYAQGSGGNAFVLNTANGGVANTADYGTFQNDAGLTATWDLNQAGFVLGYDHQNVLATSGQFDAINHAAEMLAARNSFRAHPKVELGWEATADFTAYEDNLLNDYNAYTVGPYVMFRPGQFLTVTARGGYVYYQFQSTSSTIKTASQNGWYGGVNITHQPTAALSYSVEFGHELQPGIQTDLLEDWYVRPSLTWKPVKDLAVAALLFYEHGHQGPGSVGTLPGADASGFDWYGCAVNLQYVLTSRLVLSLDYRLTFRSSNTPDDSYQQNLALLQLTYHFK